MKAPLDHRKCKIINKTILSMMRLKQIRRDLPAAVLVLMNILQTLVMIMFLLKTRTISVRNNHYKYQFQNIIKNQFNFNQIKILSHNILMTTNTVIQMYKIVFLTL